MKRYKFINTFIDNISFEETVAQIKERINSSTKTDIVFINAFKIYLISKNQDLAKAISSAEMILPDGVSIVWASKLFSIPEKGRVNGTDLFETLLKKAEEWGKSVYLLGATQENVEFLVTCLKKSYPKLSIAGYRNGYFKEDESMSVVEQINESQADMLFLGISSPNKELWLHKYKEHIDVPVCQGVGGSFDVVAGLIPRAPLWMQKSGLEWFYRIIREPRRMFWRYFVSNSVFILLALKAWFQQRMRF